MARPWSLPQRQITLQEPETYGSVNETITIHLKGVVDETVSVKRCDAPYCLCPPGFTDVKYVHNGRVLCRSMSFAFLGVNDGDEIHVVGPQPRVQRPVIRPPVPRNARRLDKLRERFDATYAPRFRDPDAVFEQLRDSSDPLTAGESARLADLFRTRVETSVSGFRRVCTRFSRMASGDGFKRPQEEAPVAATVVPEKALCPSSEQLPGMWLSSPSAGLTAEQA